MFSLMIRAVIIYVLLIVCVRLMGKRQIGELQPTELVITILMSDIATMPLQNVNIPLLQPVAVIMCLIALELLFSVFSLKFRPFRTVLQGNSVLVIRDGVVLQDAMRKLRYSVDDIVEALRLKDIFDISEVAFAYVETNGSLSVLPKETPVTQKSKAELPCLVISDGSITEKEFSVCNLTREKLDDILKQQSLRAEDVFLMTYTKSGNTNIVKKEGVR